MKNTLVLILALLLAGCNVTAFNVFAYDPYAAMQPTSTQAATVTATLTEMHKYEGIKTATPTPETACTVTAAEALHLRSGPGTGYSVIGYLSPGDLLTVTQDSGAWLHVAAGDLTGWVHSEYCR